MKRIGSRTEPPVVAQATGALLLQGALFSEAIAAMSDARYIRKGVYRFKTHEEANRQDLESVVDAMVRVVGRAP
jgi:hypothetical protein